ncbi:MAG: hypothetical protein RL701_3735, partial [Pseudomonadota bacterium]
MPRIYSSICAYVLLLSLLACTGCSAAGSTTRGDGAAASGGSRARLPVTVWTPRCFKDCEDFPSAAIFDTKDGSAPPSNAPALFGDANNFAGSGPCVLEPQLSEGKDRPGSLFPSNWLRPRFRFAPSAGENLWEIRVHADQERNDLVAYTTRTTWTMPREIWESLALSVLDTPITVTIRGLNQQQRKQPSGTRGTFSIAPVTAVGKLVYWATSSSDVKPDTSKLVGFDVGDESVIDALTIPQVGERAVRSAGGRELRGKYDDAKGVAPGAVQCIGCHVSTPDGAAVAFTDHWPWNNVLSSIEATSVGTQPSYVTPFAQLLLNQPWLGMQTFSEQHWTPGDRVVVSVYSPRSVQGANVGYSDGAPYPSRGDRLLWIDLESKAVYTPPTQGDIQQPLNQALQAELNRSFGLIALDGEKRSAATPAFSHDGSRIVYTSADVTQDGRISGNNQEVDLYSVPYNQRRGGTVSPVSGASERQVGEYYPAFSADDSLIAFNRIAKLDNAPIYYRPDGEIYVIPSEGGKPTRLNANDPPKCGGQVSPGIINSWPKWSPSASTVAPVNQEFDSSHTYYWLVFSSARAYTGQFEVPKNQYSPNDTRASQLYVTAIVRDNGTGELTTYPAIYLWNQDPRTSNLTPAWDEFK